MSGSIKKDSNQDEHLNRVIAQMGRDVPPMPDSFRLGWRQAVRQDQIGGQDRLTQRRVFACRKHDLRVRRDSIGALAQINEAQRLCRGFIRTAVVKGDAEQGRFCHI